MAENDNKDFEFIQEQVIEKKRKKLKKRLFQILVTFLLAILFGLVASATFAIAEPKFFNFLHKDEKAKTPISFTTPTPEPQNPTVTVTPVDLGDGGNTGTNNNVTPEPEQVQTDPVIQKITADLTDLQSMSDEIHKMTLNVDKSIVDITCTFPVVDWFNKSVDKTVDTTGVIVADNTADYLILVSLDRVKDANSIKLKFSDTAYVDAAIQDYESELNLALLAVAKEDIPSIYLNNLQVAELSETYLAAVGSPVVALGSPNGHPDSMDVGIITSKGSWADITDNKIELFNTNIEDNTESDGIIVNLDGKIVGIITRTLKEDDNKDISTVIGISKIKSYIEKMANQKPRIYFGIKADDLIDSAKQEHDVSNGIYVNEVLADSPAFKAGMKSGDIIMSVDDDNVLNVNSFYYMISSLAPDTQITVKVKRTSGTEDKDMDIKVVLGEKPQ